MRWMCPKLMTLFASSPNSFETHDRFPASCSQRTATQVDSTLSAAEYLPSILFASQSGYWFNGRL